MHPGCGLGITLEPFIVNGLADDYLVLRFERVLATDDVAVSLELSSDLVTWDDGPAAVVFLGRERTGATTEALIFRSAIPISSESRLFARARVEQR